MKSTFSVDQVNLGLLLLAGLAAYILPFQLLLFSFVFLGPLHYLTEISWLHDRKYFTLHKYDPWILVVGSMFFMLLGSIASPESAEFVWLLLLVAFCAAYIKSWWQRLLIVTLGIIVLEPFFGSTVSYVVAILIPTVIHIFIFTLLFMALGALKSNSTLGYINAGLFILISLVLIFLPPLELLFLKSFVEANYTIFASIGEALAKLIPLESDLLVNQIAGFLAFAYTYHYLNWFSKTSIIEWHRITIKRAFIIGLLYALAVGAYITSNKFGLTVLLSLSFLHVVLEFPLNFKSIEGVSKYVYSGLRGLR